MYLLKGWLTPGVVLQHCADLLLVMNHFKNLCITVPRVWI